jgi:AraC family transcriptional regulator, regulatory protein of adaptative response / DNA-3-methyladenine glycosylase II
VTVELRPVRDADLEAVRFLAPRAVPGLEEVVDGVYRRVVRTAAGPRVIDLGDPAARPILGSEAATAAADLHLGRDPLLGPLVAARPGLRVPGSVDGGELAIRAVLGQQISLAAARALAGRLVAAAGEPLPDPAGTLTHAWPEPVAVTEVAGSLPMPRARQRAVAAVAGALADGLRLEPGADPAATRAALLELPGIGPWTAEYVAMRALSDPDAWLPTDVGVRHGLARLGVGPEAADAWRPYRAHAVVHLWAAS